jgi:hypothetical protein
MKILPDHGYLFLLSSSYYYFKYMLGRYLLYSSIEQDLPVSKVL